MKYDKVVYWHLGPSCNFSCEYCISAQPASNFGLSALRKIYHKLLLIRRKSGGATRLDSQKVVSWLKEIGGVFNIIFTGGGEPFLSPGFVSACEGITRTHFVSIITNFVLPAVVEFSQRIDPSRVIFVNASLHIDQLEKRKLMGKYIDNCHLYKNKGFSVGATVVAYPGLRDKIKKYREDFYRYGIDFRCIHFSGWYKNRYYPDAYTKEDIELYQLDETMFKKPPRLCNAGHNVCVMLENNHIVPCHCMAYHKIGSLFSKVNWNDKLINCNQKYCGCPFYFYEKDLFDVAVSSNL
jgi:MoaA/NifB/PqqE/SkfB family radical SAM enzyme